MSDRASKSPASIFLSADWLRDGASESKRERERERESVREKGCHQVEQGTNNAKVKGSIPVQCLKASSPWMSVCGRRMEMEECECVCVCMCVTDSHGTWAWKLNIYCLIRSAALKRINFSRQSGGFQFSWEQLRRLNEAVCSIYKLCPSAGTVWILHSVMWGYGCMYVCMYACWVLERKDSLVKTTCQKWDSKPIMTITVI